MNVTLSLDDDLVKTVRKIAVEKDTTLTALVRDFLEQLAEENTDHGRISRERRALEQAFQKLQVNVTPRTWKRADLYERR